MEVEKFNLLLECLLPYTHPIIYPKCIGSGIQNNGKPNKIFSVMTVCRHFFFFYKIITRLTNLQQTITK